MKFQCGDFFVLRGFGLISRGIRFLSSIRYGIPFKETFSHVESAIDEEYNISAEADGVRRVLNNRKKVTGAYAKVYRFIKFDEEDKNRHKEEAAKHEGIGYAFWRYALDAVRIIVFVLILLWLFIAALDWLVGIVILAIIIFLMLIKGYLKSKDLITEDCTEAQSLIYSAYCRWFPLPKPRNEFPNGMVQVWENLVKYKVAVVVAVREKGGEWEWKLDEVTPPNTCDTE
jgi:hypothetical protein